MVEGGTLLIVPLPSHRPCYLYTCMYTPPHVHTKRNYCNFKPLLMKPFYQLSIMKLFIGKIEENSIQQN